METNAINPRTRLIGLVIFIFVCLGAGGLGAIATTPQIEGWYKTLAKPSWNPPDSVFGPVWTTLFIMMGTRRLACLAAWRIQGGVGSARALRITARSQCGLVVDFLRPASARLGIC